MRPTFKRCFRLEDEFSYHARQGQQWVIESVDLEELQLPAVLQQDGKPVGEAQTFDLTTSSRVMVGNGFGTLESLQAGQTVLFNLTWVTLYGPGRILQIWLDQPSRSLATTHQRQRHHNHVRERGLPGCGGVQIRVKCGMLLEGFRPKHIVRFYPATWKVEALPREEQFHGRE